MKQPFSSERTSEEYLVLNSCGQEEFFEIDGRCMRPYGRRDYHILYVKEGICRLTVEGKTEKLPQGTVVLFRPGEPQQYEFLSSDRSVSCYIHFTGKGCEHILNEVDFPEGHTVNIGKNIAFEEIFEKMLREYSIKGRHSELYCGGLLAQLLAVIARGMETEGNNPTDKNRQVAETACVYIYDNLKTVTVPELARESYLSVGRFSHIFKEITGKAPLEYIIGMRMQRARDMLVNTDFPISKIAEESGYADHNYFSRLFKKKYRVSPVEYRKRM